MIASHAMIEFDGDQLAKLDALGQRLAAELRAVVRAVPLEHRSVRGMAEYFGVDRNLCQRALAAADSSRRGIETLVRLPSARQLVAFVDAAERKGIESRAARSLRQAIQSYEA